MARYFECDICEKKLDPDQPVMELIVPAEWVMDDPETPQLHADVCSWDCLRDVTEKFDPTKKDLTLDDVYPETVQKPKPAPRRVLDEGPKNNMPGVRIKTAGYQQSDI